MRFTIKTVAMTVAFPFCLSAAAVAAENETAEIAAAVAEQMQSNAIDGTVLVAHQGEVLHQAGFGDANKAWSVKNTPATKFRIASMTKSFTAVLVMQLAEAGALDLDTPFRRYLPDYPAEHGDRITVRQLLRHTSGIKHFAELPGWRDGKFRPPMTDEAFVAAFAGEPLNFEPGSESRYSNSNYYLLGLIIEKLTGKPYAEVITERIFEPLGMRDSGEFKDGEIVDRLASDYMPNGEEISCEPASAAYCASGYVNMALFQATGSLHSTVGDLLKWDQGLYGETLLGEESKAILFNAAEPMAWVVGALPVDDAGTTVPVIAYNGGINGYTSFIARFPQSNHTVIILNNNGAGYNALVTATIGIAGALFSD